MEASRSKGTPVNPVHLRQSSVNHRLVAWMCFSSFLLWPLVSRVMRRMLVSIRVFCDST